MKTRRVLAVLLVIGVFCAFSITAFADNVSYAFNVQNNGQTMTPYTGGSNTKLYINDPATIKLSYTDATTGDGFYMYLAYRTWLFGYKYHKSTVAYWYNNTNNLLHPAYLEDMAITNTAYYILGRVDDTSPTGTIFTANGLFNSDYTNP